MLGFFRFYNSPAKSIAWQGGLTETAAESNASGGRLGEPFLPFYADLRTGLVYFNLTLAQVFKIKYLEYEASR